MISAHVSHKKIRNMYYIKIFHLKTISYVVLEWYIY